MWFFGPPRSKFGKWLERKGLTQTELSAISGVADSTISGLVTGRTKKPSAKVGRKLTRACKQIDPYFDERDFWNV